MRPSRLPPESRLYTYQLAHQLEDEMAFSRRIAVRDLLDRVRERMLERPLKPAERSVDGWDTFLKGVEDVDLANWGLGREDQGWS